MRALYLLLLFLCIAGPAAAGSADADKVPESAAQSVAAAPIRLYQRFLSRADGDRCPMTPSCSSYTRQAIERHGPFWGWIMACDRLMRCGRDELKHSPPVATQGGIRCADPLDNNDFWMH